MIADMLKELRLHVSERLTSPLLGSFAMSWCLWNYKFLMVLFSKDSVVKSLELIKTYVFPDGLTILTHGIILPAASAALYIFVYPYPARFVFEFSRKRQKEVLETRRKIEDETPLTLEESRRIYSELHDANRQFDVERESFSREIARLKQIIQSMEERDSTPAVQIKRVAKKTSIISDSQLALLERIASNYLTEKEILDLARDRIQTEFDLGELSNANFIDQRARGDFVVYVATHEGRRKLLEARDDVTRPLIRDADTRPVRSPAP